MAARRGPGRHAGQQGERKGKPCAALSWAGNLPPCWTRPSQLQSCQPSRSSVRKVIHIDIDAFYAFTEQRDDPALRGKPVVVGGSRERGAVAAASYEARRFGVRSAMSGITARRKCPELVFVRPRFDVFKTVSRQIRCVLAERTRAIERREEESSIASARVV